MLEKIRSNKIYIGFRDGLLEERFSLLSLVALCIVVTTDGIWSWMFLGLYAVGVFCSRKPKSKQT